MHQSRLSTGAGRSPWAAAPNRRREEFEAGAAMLLERKTIPPDDFPALKKREKPEQSAA